MSQLGDRKDLTIGKTGFSLGTILSGKRGFCYFDGKRYEVLAGIDIHKWAEVIVITLTPEPTIIETLTTFPPLSYQLPAGGYQPVSQQHPLPVTSSLDEAAIRKAIFEATAGGTRNRTGIPIFRDGFDYPLDSWNGIAAFTGALGWDSVGAGTIARNIAYKFMGTGCLGITTAAVAFANQQARKKIPVPQNRRIGLEVYMAGQDWAVSNFSNFAIAIHYNSRKTSKWDAYWITAGQYMGGVGYWPLGAATAQLIPGFVTDVDGGAFGSDVYWHYCKLFVDLDKGEYVKVIWDQDEKDLSGTKAAHPGAPTLYDTLMISLTASNAGWALACLTLFDEVVVTSDEP